MGPDMSTIREMPWMKTKSFMIMGDLYDTSNNELYRFAPRSILKKQIEELGKLGNLFSLKDRILFKRGLRT